MVAELLDRVLDAQFDIDFDEAGAFQKENQGSRILALQAFGKRGTAAIPDLYVGPTDDPKFDNRRVTNFSALKSRLSGQAKNRFHA